MAAAPERCVLAIDPGKSKCGVAVVSSSGAISHRSIAKREELPSTASALAAQFQPEAVILGDGTHSKAVWEELASAGLENTVLVDERHTSEAARDRYLDDHPPSGLARWMPRGLRTPDVPYDDYVAVILGERWWQELRRRA